MRRSEIIARAKEELREERTQEQVETAKSILSQIEMMEDALSELKKQLEDL